MISNLKKLFSLQKFSSVEIANINIGIGAEKKEGGCVMETLHVPTQMEIQKIKKKAVEACNNITITTVIENLKLYSRKRGTQTYIDCPYCGTAAKKQACSVSKTSGWKLFHCFSCGNGGGAIKYYQLVTDNESWIMSAISLARLTGRISLDEYNSVMETGAARDKALSDEKTFIVRQEAEESALCEKASNYMTDLVYRHMLLLPQFALNDAGRKHLTGRGLSEAEIESEGYFSYTDEFSTKNLVESIKKENPDFSPVMLMGVPGFYFLESKKDKKKGWWVFKKPYPTCLGIPIKNYKGQIVALQMRNMEVGTASKEGSKYFYVSSSSVHDERGRVMYGAGTGTPVDVTYPKKITTPTIFIGEGKFKMRQVAKMGGISLSIQGINSYALVADEVSNILQLHPELKENMSFCICFDMDLYQKEQIGAAAIGLSNYLKQNFPGKRVEITLWNGALGKGIDDFFEIVKFQNLRLADYLRVVSMSVFEKSYNAAVKKADEEYLKADSDIVQRNSQKWRDLFFRFFYVDEISKNL